MVAYNGRKFLNRLFEPLVLLATLGPVQGERIPNDDFSLSDTDIGVARERRRILEELCKMCDFQKGGGTVTAMALEDTPSGAVYWAATSEPGGKKTVPFLEMILRMLSVERNGLDEEEKAISLENTLFEEFTCFHWPRLQSTWRILQTALQEERDRIRRHSTLSCDEGKLLPSDSAHG
jgi:hypothetical protein